jgi:DNA invertase Pin-like site-specific DNA recombinase
VRVIDADLGRSGAEASAREGFKDLVADVGLGRVGIVFGIEVSRLARNNADWYQLLDLCALTDTLIADADGVYHPADFNDRLVLGLKGTMSEAELHLIRSRLTAGLRHKAARGELRQFLPVGLDYDETGAVVISADEAVVEAIATVFRRFAELGTARQVLLSLRGDGLLIPRRPTRTGRVHWAPATYPAVHDFLTNPVYAGAFVFGRTRTEKRIDATGKLAVTSSSGGRRRIAESSTASVSDHLRRQGCRCDGRAWTHSSWMLLPGSMSRAGQWPRSAGDATSTAPLSGGRFGLEGFGCETSRGGNGRSVLRRTATCVTLRFSIVIRRLSN